MTTALTPQMKNIHLHQVSVPIVDGGLFDRYRMRSDVDEVAKTYGIDDVTFFDGVEKQGFDHGPMGIMPFPIFYYDMGLFQAIFTADLAGLKRLMPSEALSPLALLPGRGMIAFTAFQYRVTEVDSYNEIAISIVVSRPFRRSFGPLTLMSGLMSGESWTYVWKLPVTTELACTGGRLGYNYPKTLERIDYTVTADHDECVLFDGAGARVLTLRGRHLTTKTGHRPVHHGISVKSGEVLDVEVKQNLLETASSVRGGDFTLELGEGEIPNVLRSLRLGRMLRYDYTPRLQTQLCGGTTMRPE